MSTAPIWCWRSAEYLPSPPRGAQRNGACRSHGARQCQGDCRRRFTRLKNWDISADQLARLQRTGTATRTLDLECADRRRSSWTRPLWQGLHFGAGDLLYRIVDLSAVWLLADVFEQDLAQIRPGQMRKITVQAYPGRVFDGHVAFVYPTVNAQTRTAKVRIEVPNPELRSSRYVRRRRDRCSGRERSGLTVPDLRGDRQRHTVRWCLSSAARAVRAAPREAGRQGRRLLEIREGLRRREGGRDGQFPDRRREQPPRRPAGLHADAGAGRADQMIAASDPLVRAQTCSWSLGDGRSSSSPASMPCATRRSTPSPISPTRKSSSTPSIPARRRR